MRIQKLELRPAALYFDFVLDGRRAWFVRVCGRWRWGWYRSSMDELDDLVTIVRWGSVPDSIAEVLGGSRELPPRVQDDERAGLLYDALGVVAGDERFRLLELKDGRWGLFGRPVEGERFAVESFAPEPPNTIRMR
jgi:hypothetical protein